ncbi:hypothetical protein [Marinicella sp. W31]|uniref:hypothetical protein n=1 Tax=Marinicella sp. W31 TaxID=3023713 RepID=UPI003757D986
MNKMHVVLILILCGSSAHAEPMVFEDQDIQTILQQNNSIILEHQFLQNYFTAADPVAFVDIFIQQQKNPVIREKLLFSLADELAYHVQQTGHKAVIERLKNYQPVVMRMHDEGPLEVPVFNIHAKSAGTENQWSAQSIETQFLKQLKHQPVKALPVIQQHLEKADNITLLGLKNAISKLSDQQLKALTQYFIDQPAQAIDYQPLLVALNGRQHNSRLATEVLPYLSATHAVQLLRSSGQTNLTSDHSQLLMSATQQPAIANFAISMMKPLAVSEPNIAAFLQSELASEVTGQNAAFALSAITQGFEKLSLNYRSAQTSVEQNNILLALSLNPASGAKQAIAQLHDEQRISQQQQQWLRSMSGGRHE